MRNFHYSRSKAKSTTSFGTKIHLNTLNPQPESKSSYHSLKSLNSIFSSLLRIKKKKKKTKLSLPTLLTFILTISCNPKNAINECRNKGKQWKGKKWKPREMEEKRKRWGSTWPGLIFKIGKVTFLELALFDVIIDSRNWTTLFKEGSGEVESVCGEAPLIIQIEVV